MRPSVAILHDGVAHRALVTFDVQFDAGRILLFDDRAVPLKAVVRDGEEGAAQRVKVRDRGRLTRAWLPCLPRSAPDSSAARRCAVRYQVGR